MPYYIQVIKESPINCINHCYHTHIHLQANYTHNSTITITKIPIYMYLNLNFNTLCCLFFRAAPISIHCHDDTVIIKFYYFYCYEYCICCVVATPIVPRVEQNKIHRCICADQVTDSNYVNKMNATFRFRCEILFYHRWGPNNNTSFYTIFSCVHCVVQ